MTELIRYKYDYSLKVYYPSFSFSFIISLVSEPKIVDVSEDLIGSNAVCCGKPIKLYCKAKGKPKPTYSWHFKKRPFDRIEGVVLKDGALTIPKRLYIQHHMQGKYRCLASNAWGSVLSRPIQVQILGKRLLRDLCNILLKMNRDSFETCRLLI